MILIAFSTSVKAKRSFSITTNSAFETNIVKSDSLLKKPLAGENPAASVAVISSFLAVVVPILGFSGGGLGFDPLPLTLILAIVGIGSAIAGLIRRKKLMTGKYANRPNLEKLPLGQARSIFGLLFIPVGFLVLVLVANGCS